MEKWDNLFWLHETMLFVSRLLFLLVFSPLVFDLFLMRIDWFWWRKQSLEPLFYYLFTNLFGLRYHLTSLQLGFLCPYNFPIKSFYMFLTGKSMEKIFAARKPYKLFESHISRLSFLCWFQIWYLLKSNGDYFLWISAKYAQIGSQE